MAKRLSKKKELWEVIIPEPFNIDPVLKKEDLIQTMSNFENITEMNSFLFECLALPENRMVISASEFDVFKTIESLDSKSNLAVSLVNDNNSYAIVVKDKEENILGRGTLSRIGEKLTILDAKAEMESELDTFYEKYEVGIKNIESLVFQAKSLRDNLIKNQDTEENN